VVLRFRAPQDELSIVFVRFRAPIDGKAGYTGVAVPCRRC
jgi:hypothetical protein